MVSCEGKRKKERGTESQFGNDAIFVSEGGERGFEEEREQNSQEIVPQPQAIKPPHPEQPRTSPIDTAAAPRSLLPPTRPENFDPDERTRTSPTLSRSIEVQEGLPP